MWRPRDPIRIVPFEVGESVLEPAAIRDDARLGADPGADLSAPGSGREVRVAFRGRDWGDRPFDDDLALQGVPAKQNAGPGVDRQLSRLAGIEVGEDGEARGAVLL